MINFNETYIDNNTYPVTLGNLFKNLCSQVGLEVGNTDFPNNDYVVLGNPFTNNETCKTVLSSIAQLAGGFAHIGRDNKVYIKNLSLSDEYVENIDGHIYNSDFTKNEYYGAINTIVIGLKDVEGENITKEDFNITVAKEIKISEEYFLIDHTERNKVIDSIFSALNGLTYLPFNVSYYGLPYLDVGDKIQILDNEDNPHASYILKHNFKYNGAYSGKLESPKITETQEKIKNAQDLKTKFRKVELSVDKINGKIESIVESVDEQSEKMTQIEQDIDSINSKVSSVVDITNSVEGISKLEVTDAMEGDILELHILGNNTVFKKSYISSETYISSKTILTGSPQLKITDKDGYLLNARGVLRQKDGIYDEYVIKDGKSYIIQRISNDGSFILSDENLILLEDINIPLNEGLNIIELVYYTANMWLRYVTLNKFTDVYATKVEMNSAIEESATEITANVTKIVKDESDILQTQISELEIATGNISLEVSEVTAKSEELEQTTEELETEVQNKISIDEIIAKLNLAIKDGQGIIEITGNQVIINSDCFELTADGQVTATAGTIAGLTMWKDGVNSWLTKYFTHNGQKYVSGLLIPDNYESTFIFAGALDTESGWNTSNANLQIFHNGLVKAKWFNVNGESGYFNTTFDSGRTAMALTATTLDFRIDNDANELFTRFERKVEGFYLYLHTAPFFCIYDNLHSRLLYQADTRDGNVPYHYFTGEMWMDRDLDGTYVQVAQSGDWSDGRLKEDIKDCTESALDRINQMKFKQFTWNETAKKDNVGKHIDIGVIAGDLQKIDENYVDISPRIYNGEKQDLLSINLLNLLTTATKGIQELSTENNELKKQITNQQKVIDFLVNKLNCKEELEGYLKGE